MGFEEDSVLLASPFAFITPPMPPREEVNNQKTTAAMAKVVNVTGTPNSVVKKLTFEKPPAIDEHPSINGTFAISPTSLGQTVIASEVIEPDESVFSPPRPKHSPSHNLDSLPICLAECPQCNRQFMTEAHVKSHLPFCVPRPTSVVIDLDLGEEPEWDLEITRFLSRVSHSQNLFRTTSELLLVEAATAVAPLSRTPVKSSSKGSLHSSGSPPFCEEPSAIDGRQSPTFGMDDETATAEVFAEALRQAEDMHSFMTGPQASAVSPSSHQPESVQCGNCGRKFGTAERLAPHARVCVNVFGNRAEPKRSSRLSALHRRDEPKTPQPPTPSSCSAGGFSKKEVDQQPFSCPNCGRVFRAEAAAEVHGRVCERIFGKFTGLKTVKTRKQKLTESPAYSIFKTLRRSREFQRQSIEGRSHASSNKVDASVSPVRWSSVVDKYAPPPPTHAADLGDHPSDTSIYDPSRYSSASSSASSSSSTALRSSLGRSLELQYARLREQVKACTERLRDRSISSSSFRAG